MYGNSEIFKIYGCIPPGCIYLHSSVQVELCFADLLFYIENVENGILTTELHVLTNFE